LSQQQRVLEHLQAGHTLTRLESWDRLGIIEVPARINELRNAGHKIITERQTVTNRYGEKVSIAIWSMPEPTQAELEL